MFKQWDGQFIQLAPEDERKYRSAFIIVQIIFVNISYRELKY